MKLGKLFVISGPSGAGKSTLTKDILKAKDELYLSVSATTRKPRAGEEEGVSYYFISMEEFQKDAGNGEFLEYACVHGNYYGTLRREVEGKLNSGKNIILEIDVQGGEQIKEKFPDAVRIFVTTPSAEELKRRLTGRATDSDDVIRTRLENSLKELQYQDRYNYVIINDVYEEALAQLGKIIDEVISK